MRLAMMIIGTLLAVFLIIKYIKGKKYADLIEGLEDDNEYPLKDLYVIGFSMNDNSIFKIHDKNKDELISQAKLAWVKNDKIMVRIEIFTNLDIIAIIAPKRLLYPEIFACLAKNFFKESFSFF